MPSAIDQLFERRLGSLVNARVPGVLQQGLKGVERESHAEALITLGCEYAQGNHFHYPLYPGKFAALMGGDHRANA